MSINYNPCLLVGLPAEDIKDKELMNRLLDVDQLDAIGDSWNGVYPEYVGFRIFTRCEYNTAISDIQYARDAFILQFGQEPLIIVGNDIT